MKSGTVGSRAATLSIVLGLASWAVAQQVEVTDPGSLVWDIPNIQEVTLDYNMEIDNDEAYFEVWFERGLQQSGTGKLSWSGPGVFHMELLDDETGISEYDFEGTQKTTGSVTSSGGVCKVKTVTTITGSVFLEGANRLVKATESNAFAVNNTELSASGKYTTKASASGLGSISGSHSWVYPTLDIGNGHWWLNLENLTTTANKVSGNAVVTLHSGVSHQFTVKGTYSSKTQMTKLLLMGQGAAKGGNLTVTLAGGQIKSIKGRIFGQMVNVAF